MRELADARGLLIGYASRNEFYQLSDADQYEQTASAEFNILTPENQMKWDHIHPERDLYNWESDRHVEFAEAHDMQVHGHALLWHEQNPQWLLDTPADQLEGVMNEHIDTVMGHYAGRVQIWDVVNEAISITTVSDYRPTLWYDAMGPAYIEKAFVRARQADPNAILLYNDFGAETINAKSDALYAQMQIWLANGAPIDGIGFQMHIDADVFSNYSGHEFEPYQSFIANMQRFADLGLDIYITEMDVIIRNPFQYRRQGEVYREILERCLAQPACKGFQTWGFVDKYSWHSEYEPLIFDNTYAPKPAYYTLQYALNTLRLQAEEHDAASGVTTYDPFIGDVDQGDWIRFDNVPLNADYTQLRVRYAKGNETTTNIEVRLNDLTGPKIGEMTTVYTGDWNAFVEKTASIQSPNGANTLYFVFTGDYGVGNIDWLRLEKGQGVPSTPVPTPDQQGNLTLEAELPNSSFGVQLYDQFIADVDGGDWLVFENFDLGRGYRRLRARYAKGNDVEGQAEVRLDSLDGPAVATLSTVNTGDWNMFSEGATGVVDAVGVHTLYVVFTGGGGVGNFDWFRFEEAVAEATSTPTLTPTLTPEPTATLTFTSTPEATATSTPLPDDKNILYLSAARNGRVDGVSFRDEDIVGYDVVEQQWRMVFDGSDVGLAPADVNAFEVQADGAILLSLNKSVKLADLGRVDDSDIVRFVPSILGVNTAGIFEYYFDGSDVGLTTNGEDIDAIGFAPDGRLVISTLGSFKSNAPIISGKDSDLFVFTAQSMGQDTQGNWSLYLDGSDIGLQTDGDDIAGLWINPSNNDVDLKPLRSFNVSGGISGDSNDLLRCQPLALGVDTICSNSIVWDGASVGWDEQAIDGVARSEAWPPQMQLDVLLDTGPQSVPEVDDSLDDDISGAEEDEAEDPVSIPYNSYLPVVKR
ncbi:MAG: endo-1,4-beta-xylanase [Caldilineaceae bacterium]|nr:endo-1,4-beta-xylanase [Caldilineaceae bacterium]